MGKEYIRRLWKVSGDCWEKKNNPPKNSILYLDVYSYAIRQLKSKEFSPKNKDGKDVSPEYNIFRKVQVAMKQNCKIGFFIDDRENNKRFVEICELLEKAYSQCVFGIWIANDPAEKVACYLQYQEGKSNGIVVSEDSDVFVEPVPLIYQWSKKILWDVKAFQEKHKISPINYESQRKRPDFFFVSADPPTEGEEEKSREILREHFLFSKA